MGAMQNNGDVTSRKRGKRGSVKNKNRLAALGKRRPGATASWALCKSELMLMLVHRITQLGGAVTFGLSRDGGAHMLTLMLDESRETLWYNGDADLDEEMDEVVHKLDDLSA